MPRRRSRVDNLVFLPWWLNGSLAIISVAVLAKPLPLLAAVAFVFFVVMAVLSALRATLNSQMLERQTGLDSLRELPWKQFENLLGEAYRRHGYQVTETLGGGADGGVDLVLRRDGKVTLVQCKRWRGKPVQVAVVRELYGVLMDRRADAAKLVATTSFTPNAVAFARGKPIELVDSAALLGLLRGVQTSGNIAAHKIPKHAGVIEALACPQCGAKMVLREARRGGHAGQAFWGCSRYPGCRGIRAC